MLVDAYSPPRRGGVARSAGVVGSAKSKLCRSDHPVCATSVASRYFLIGAATPPLRRGEYVTVITNHSTKLGGGLREPRSASPIGRSLKRSERRPGGSPRGTTPPRFARLPS